MSKPKSKPKKIRVRAPFTDGNAPAPATMAVDAAPRAGDGARRITLPAYVSQIPGSIGFVPDDTEEET